MRHLEMKPWLSDEGWGGIKWTPWRLRQGVYIHVDLVEDAAGACLYHFLFKTLVGKCSRSRRWGERERVGLPHRCRNAAHSYHLESLRTWESVKTASDPPWDAIFPFKKASRGIYNTATVMPGMRLHPPTFSFAHSLFIAQIVHLTGTDQSAGNTLHVWLVWLKNTRSTYFVSCSRFSDISNLIPVA